ncbi:hypothetical protein ACX80Z_11895 [Arthrobacter sp. TMT4-20]
MLVDIDAPHVSAPDRPGLDQGLIPSPQDDRHDPIMAAARAAGRMAGERLANTPLTPRQRVAVTSVMGGGVR